MSFPKGPFLETSQISTMVITYHYARDYMYISLLIQRQFATYASFYYSDVVKLISCHITPEIGELCVSVRSVSWKYFSIVY